MSTKLATIAMFASAIALVPRRVAAEVAIEEYVGERPADASAIIGKFELFLSEQGPGSLRSPTKRQFRHARSPAIVDPTLTTEKLTEQITVGYKRWVRGDWDAAVSLLSAVIQAARDNPAVSLGLDRDVMIKALVGLAMSYQRAGDATKARATMHELLQSYPEEPVTRGNYNHEAEDFYNDEHKKSEHEERGKLHVHISDRSAHIVINEVERGHNGSFEEHLLPATYRVLVRVGQQAFRYDVEVVAGVDASLDLDWEFELAWHLSDDWIGFALPRPSPDKELAFFKEASRAGGTLVVIGIRSTPQHRYLTGRFYDEHRNAILRSGEIELGTDEDARMRALARYLHDEGSSPDVHPMGGGPRAPASEPVRTRWPIYVAGGFAVAAIGVGAYLVHLDGLGTCGLDPPVQCEFLYGTGPYGWVTIGTGVAVGGFAAYWYLREGKRSSGGFAVVPTRSGVMATVGGAF